MLLDPAPTPRQVSVGADPSVSFRMSELKCISGRLVTTYSIQLHEQVLTLQRL